MYYYYGECVYVLLCARLCNTIIVCAFMYCYHCMSISFKNQRR